MTEDKPRVLWRPDAASLNGSNLTRYHDWLLERGQATEVARGDYEALWRWSTEDVPRFWLGVYHFFDVACEGSTGSSAMTAPRSSSKATGEPTVLSGPTIMQAEWFEGVRLNYAEQVFRRRDDSRPMFVTVAEDGATASDSRGRNTVVEHAWGDVASKVADLQAVLAQAGVRRGSRVAGFLPNTEHAVVAFLATAGLGAIWSCCSPEFGAEAVLDRFAQIGPSVLIACRGYGYGGKYHDRTAVIEQLASGLPTLSLKLLVDTQAAGSLSSWDDWREIPRTGKEIVFERLPFDSPLWILYSSGTTGAPKAIVHGHGGCLLEHLKYLSLQADVREGERFFWFTTTGWMMWNFLQASMLVGGVPVFYDGSPGYPGLHRLWRLAADLPIHHFGTSAPFIHACMRSGVSVRETLDLSALRSIGSTGAPLSPEGFAYVHERIKADVWLTSMSGGTDVCTAFVGGNPWSVVYEGWIQGRALGCALFAYDENGCAVVGREGEMVVEQAMPSMPMRLWDDRDGRRLYESYFADIPGVWRHGDWITVAASGEVKIHGRSDATLNRQGVRIGTAELYRYVLKRDGIEDALVINYVDAAGNDHMPLFLVMSTAHDVDDGFRQNLKRDIRKTLSPRHVPTRIETVAEVPYTLSGKRLETPVKRLFEGRILGTVANLGSLRNPAALEHFAHLASMEQDSCD